MIGLAVYFMGGSEEVVAPTEQNPEATEAQEVTIDEEIAVLAESSASLDAELDELEALDFE